ncbi:MAG: PilC/PilY family type IV pilus protein [Burkholderiales bacterium]|nr:PilC/PilY family type IV pilus protein [Burkholderiales bacterium]
MKPVTLKFRICQIGLALAGVFGVAFYAQTADTDIASEPLAQAASGVKPNIMFILDDSGSMAWDFIPDYVNDSHTSTASTTAACFDSGDTTGPSNDRDDAAGLISGRPDACAVGDPPFMSSNFNKVYYNPAIYYRPAANADGTDKTVMNAGNTSNWTAVPTDAFGIQNNDQLGNNVSTVNLVTGYPERVWCTSPGDSPTSANCVVNSGYTYPDSIYPYGRDSSGNIKYRFGSPHYYTMQSAQYCTSAALTASTCKSGSAVVPGTHTFIAGEFCTDSELTDCAVGTALTAAHIYSGVRWCSDNGTLLTCQRKKIGNFKYAKHLGTTTSTTVTIPARAATGTITVTQSDVSSQITGITVNGIAVISGAIAASSSSTSTTASQIAAAINSHASTPDYTASASGSTVTVTAVITGTGPNGYAVAVTAPSTGTVRASATLTIDSSSNNNSRNITQITANAISIMSATCSGSFGNSVTASGGTITAGTGTNSTNERAAVASAVASCINAATATNGGYSATSSANVVTVQASLADGANANGRALAESGTISTTGSNFSGGQSAGIFSTITNMTGGAASSTGARTVRIGVGLFNHTDIVSSTTDYPKGPQRIDCSGATCTYQEEMTNFANWYSYYRTRMQMMKSAAGRAFIPIDDTYRVGFITINPTCQNGTTTCGSSVRSDKYLKINVFDSAHKSAWYSKFTAQIPRNGTPLREALSRVGRLYAGQFDGINNGILSADDPMQYSCQPNFAILSTDGYWNGNAGDKINGTAMTQQDNTDTGPYSKRTDGVFDGGSSTTVGLADVALYYYQTDLRSGTSWPDNVPTTQKDFAAHQHMTTFTLGLGLDGNLTYRSDYETATAGDFKSITQGSLNWPNPVGDTPAALDDLWHAAVNGRGAFFSASNPQELANSLSETLDALQKRVGAGAAAATSNLQPVAGDNFAFTAQYQTSDWIGDLKARTIDLSSGIVSAVPLWSAQALLDAKVYSTRNIYMPDLTDATSTGNKLKHFCWPGTSGTTCSDGSGLDAAEQAYFNPNRLPQSVSWNSAQKAVAAVDVVTSDTGRILVNWLRGETAYEDTGTVASTDLFRNRVSILGDIINAQPAYVKTSPFNYTDTGYLEFKACTEGSGTGCPSTQFPTPGQPRRGTVFAAANDGMLHAFETDVNNDPYFQTSGIGTAITSDDTYEGNNAGNGEERWAFIPSMVLPNLYKLASTPYSHRYFTDGSPAVGDVCLSNPCTGLSDWRTMLVAGLNSGGRGYYALDVTNPLAPKLLWEFKVRKPSETSCAITTADAVGATDDCDLGLTYGNPVLSKFNGQWVVFVTSGYNNTGLEPGGTERQGDGKSYLYILNAVTGAIIKKIGTGVGDGGTAGASYTDADPSGLARINNWVDNALLNNTTTAVYGGDLKGNLWRFDLDSASSSYLTAVKVATLTSGVTPQPITTKPELGMISTYHVVFVATGKFLGVSDKTDTTGQTIYAIKDDLNTNVPVIGRTTLIQQSLISGTTTRSATSNAVDWTSPLVRGWYVNLPDPGERVSVDPQLQLGSLIVASNVPSTDTCTAGGYAWINTFDYKTGSYITSDSSNIASTKLSSSVVVGINVIQLPGGAVKAIVTTADNQQLSQETPVAATTFQGKRVSWREITTDQ